MTATIDRALFRAPAILLAVHVTLLFFPPIPPITKGSLWSYILGYLFVILGVRAITRNVPGIRASWAGQSEGGRTVLGLIALAVIAAVGFSLRAVVPETFTRMSREEGLWEPLTLLIYGGAIFLLFRAARRPVDEPVVPGGPMSSVAQRGHRRLIGAGFVFLALEEIDYAGVFGGFIGRIEGIYTGSIHDVVRLWAYDVMPAVVPVVLVVLTVLAAGAAWRWNLIQPRELIRTLFSPAALWFGFGAAMLSLALLEEAQLFGLAWTLPSIEEMVELFGAIGLGMFALTESVRPSAGAQ